MGHGFMGVRLAGLGYIAGFTGFFAYLSTSMVGFPPRKFVQPKELVDIAKEYQPALHPEFYYKENQHQ